MAELESVGIEERNDDLILDVNENSESETKANNPSGDENKKGEVDGGAFASIRNESQGMLTLLATEILERLESLESPLSRECCIYRVPPDLRKLNEEAYTPQIISIGPFHHGSRRLQAMEKIKWRYFKELLQMTSLDMCILIRIIKEWEVHIRNCYAETILLSSDDCVKMVLVDASFIIVFFLTSQGVLGRDDNFSASTQRLMSTVFKDMWLLENQLPFFVIEKIYDLAFSCRSNYPSFTELTFAFFEGQNTQNMSPAHSDLKIMHFLDLLRTFFLPPSHTQQQRYTDKKVKRLYTASQLYMAGVKFKVSSSKCLFDLKFTSGVLEIPSLVLNDSTECFFRNLMALEQCHYLFDAYVTDYIRVLDFLIDTSRDVNLLVQTKTIVNELPDSHEVAILVNSLHSQIVHLGMSSDYFRLCERMNEFCENPWNSTLNGWKIILIRDYFSNPWLAAKTLAAIILLGLTLIQTILAFH